LSVSIPAELAEWVQAEAERLRVSVSSIFVDAVARARRQHGWKDYLEQGR
jgi:type II secretory pathway component PulM